MLVGARILESAERVWGRLGINARYNRLGKSLRSVEKSRRVWILRKNVWLQEKRQQRILI